MHVRHHVKHCVLLLEGHSVLAVIANLEGGASLYGASYYGLRRHYPHQQVYEGALAYSVAPHYAHFLAATEVVGEVTHYAGPPWILAIQVLAVDDLGAQARVVLDLVHADIGLHARPGGPFLQLAESVLAVLGFSAAGARRGVYPFQLPAQQVAHLVSLGVVVAYAFLPLLQIILVIASICVYCPAVKFHHCIADAIQEVAVVRHHQKGASAAAEVVLKELDGVNVQVVGGLVHYEEIRLRGQHLRYGHALDLSPAELPHQTLGRTEPEVCQDLPCAKAVAYLLRDCILRVEIIILLQEGYAYILEEQHLAP